MIMISSLPDGSAISDELLYRIIAAHEGGHLVGYKSLGQKARVEFEYDRTGRILGAVTVGEAAVDRFNDSVMGWSGVVGEYLMEKILFPSPHVPQLKWYTLEEWVAGVVEHSWLALSGGDRDAINAWYDRVGSARRAFEILSSTWGRHVLSQCYETLCNSLREEHFRVRTTLGTAIQPNVAEAAKSLADIVYG